MTVGADLGERTFQRHRFRKWSNVEKYTSKIHLWRRDTGATRSYTAVDAYLGTQVATIDKPHKGFRRDRLDGRFDRGGIFLSRKSSVLPPTGLNALMQYDRQTSILREKGEGYRYPCHLAFDQVKTAPKALEYSTDGGLGFFTLLGYGATGIAQSLPTVPPASLSTMLGELREGLPSIPGTGLARRPGRVSETGSEYLNYQFGLMPMIGDLQRVVKAARESERILKQLRRDEGLLIRRRRTLVDTVDEGSTYSHSAYVYPAGYYYLDPMARLPGICTHSTVKSQRVWFSGGFTYRFPRMGGWIDDLIEFDRVYGIIPNAATAWELIPWSWLVDWFSNVGDVMKNISYLGRDGLIMRYGYIMAETQTRTTYRNQDIEMVSEVTNKQRMRATPFGFSVNIKDLDFKQGAILTALGISRLSF